MINEKHFKIQEGKKEVTFDDLIKEAVNAVRNNIIQKFEFAQSLMDNDLIFLTKHDGVRACFTYDQPQAGINYLESLATETFMIEHQSDLSKIKLNDKKTKIELANGTLVSDEILDMLKDQSGKTQLSILKGAIVTQSYC